MNDPFLHTDFAVNRLFEQYKRTPRLIVACDFDETLYDFHNKGYKFPHVIQLLKRCNYHNFYIVIFTSSLKSRHEFIRYHCEQIGIKIDGINENVVETPFGQDGAKIFYNIFLDDRAGLGQACEILEKTLDLIESNSET